MSLDDQLRWDLKHSESRHMPPPSRFLREIIEGGYWDIPRGQALDVACGKGANALYLAEHGFEVLAMEISPAALSEARRHADERNLKISWEQADLEHAQLPLSQFDLVVDINYLQRSLIAQIKTALKTGGHVVFETFLLDQQTIGHPNNPDYLLAHNELLAHFHDFRILHYREGKFFEGAEASFRAGLLAQKIQ